MKKLVICVSVLAIAILALTSCAAEKTAGAGEIVVFGGKFDALLHDVDYADDPALEGAGLSALEIGLNETDERGLTTVNFRNAAHQVSFGRSVKPRMRGVWYDVYYPQDGSFYALYVSNAGKVVGFMENDEKYAAGGGEKLTEEELISVARDSLGELIDPAYYSHTQVSYDASQQLYTVMFYNSVGDVRLADSSSVMLSRDGRVAKVLALPEPEILKALGRITSLDGAEFDRRVESEVSRKYADYRRDDEEMLAEVVYEGVSIVSRVISIDDDGKPVVLYSVVPKMRYDITYRSEAAANRIKNGVDTHESGVTSRTVYVAVGIE